MKKLLFLSVLALVACTKPEKTEHIYTDAEYNATVLRTEILLEGEELHEVFIIKTDSAEITNHCDDCRYCMMQNPEGNPD